MWSLTWGSVPQPWDHDLSPNQELGAQPTEPPRHSQTHFKLDNAKGVYVGVGGAILKMLLCYTEPKDLNVFGLQEKLDFKITQVSGTRVAQLVKHLTSAQVMISWLVSLSPPIALSAVRAEPAWDPLSPSLSVPPLLMCAYSLCLSEYIKKKHFKKYLRPFLQKWTYKESIIPTSSLVHFLDHGWPLI